MHFYRPRLKFVRANPVKKKGVVQTSGGPVMAEPGDYVVIFPDANESRMVMKEGFFKLTYEDASDTVFCDVCLDFDGVIHQYILPWKDATTIPDPPVEGVFDTIRTYFAATPPLSVAVYSARSVQANGINAMRSWIEMHDEYIRRPDDTPLVNSLLFPTHKPAARLYVDDRGYQFTGELPSIDEIKRFTPWNKKGKITHRSIIT